jgi:hypothetical protein
VKTLAGKKDEKSDRADDALILLVLRVLAFPSSRMG